MSDLHDDKFDVLRLVDVSGYLERQHQLYFMTEMVELKP